MRVKVKLTNPTKGEEVTLTDESGTVLGTKIVDEADVANGFVTFADVPLPAEDGTLTVKHYQR